MIATGCFSVFKIATIMSLIQNKQIHYCFLKISVFIAVSRHLRNNYTHFRCCFEMAINKQNTISDAFTGPIQVCLVYNLSAVTIPFINAIFSVK